MYLMTIEDVKNELIKLDISYFKDEISLETYEDIKHDLYVYWYQLEKQLLCS